MDANGTWGFDPPHLVKILIRTDEWKLPRNGFPGWRDAPKLHAWLAHRLIPAFSESKIKSTFSQQICRCADRACPESPVRGSGSTKFTKTLTQTTAWWWAHFYAERRFLPVTKFSCNRLVGQSNAMCRNAQSCNTPNKVDSTCAFMKTKSGKKGHSSLLLTYFF